MERGLTEEGCDQLMVAARYDFLFPFGRCRGVKLALRITYPADPGSATQACWSRSRTSSSFMRSVPDSELSAIQLPSPIHEVHEAAAVRRGSAGPHQARSAPLRSCYRLSLMCRPVHMTTISSTGSYAAVAEINLRLAKVIATCWCLQRTEGVIIYKRKLPFLQ